METTHCSISSRINVLQRLQEKRKRKRAHCLSVGEEDWERVRDKTERIQERRKRRKIEKKSISESQIKMKVRIGSVTREEEWWSEEKPQSAKFHVKDTLTCTFFE